MSARLVINATILNQPRQTGLGIYTANLLPPLLRWAAEDTNFSEIVIAGTPDSLRESLGPALDHPKTGVHEIPTVSPFRRLWHLDRLVMAERKRAGCVVFYSPTHHGVVRGGIIQVITVHDLFARIFPHNYRRQYYYFRWYVPRILANTSRVIVDSECTGADLRRFYTRCPAIDVVHAAVREDLSSKTLSEVLSLRDQRFFLFLGATFPYKNCLRLIDAFAEYRKTGSARLVFVGGRDEYTDRLQRHLEQKHAGLIGDVIFVEYASVSELVWLFRHAIALMLTTLYEGFGLPALEAMACDCPVIASRAGSLPEVCDEAALFVNPTDTASITRAMLEVERDSAIRERLIQAGQENVRRFSWDKSAEKVYRVLRSCLSP
ncbi:MAG: glycosyltransferase family 1 protein [Candidatus Zixiibacteriota bacterium]